MLDQQTGLPVVVIHPRTHDAVFRASDLPDLVHRRGTAAIGMAYVGEVSVGGNIHPLAVAREPGDSGIGHTVAAEQGMAQFVPPIDVCSEHFSGDRLGGDSEFLERAAVRSHRVGIK